MRNLLGIMRAELRVMFCSPIAWLILTVFLFMTGLAFTDSLRMFYKYFIDKIELNGLTNLITGIDYGMFKEVLNGLYIYIPLITMGVMSREYSGGSIKLLYSSAVSNTQIIVGKYFAVVVYGMLMCAILFIPMGITAVIVSNTDIGLMLSGLLGTFLVLSTYAAIGLFMSSITRYQVVAAIATLGLFALLNNIGYLAQRYDFLREITYWLAIGDRIKNFVAGIVCTRDLVYFILIILMFLSFSILKLQNERKKEGWKKGILKYATVLAGVLVIGYITTLPRFSYCFDNTVPETNSLMPESREIMKQLSGKLTATTYSNILDQQYMAPRKISYDRKIFNKYIRFKPDFTLNYVFYWGHGNEYIYNHFPELSDEELFKKRCDQEDISPRRFIAQSELIDDISSEKGSLVRVLRSGDKTAKLRWFSDVHFSPFETEITTAFKTLLVKSPVIGYVNDVSHRDVTDERERGYSILLNDLHNRYGVMNQGFTVRTLSLARPIAADVDILMLSDLTRELTPTETKNFTDYVDRGGNLLITGEPRRQAAMNPILKRFGIELIEGILVRNNGNDPWDILSAQFAKKAEDILPYAQNQIATGMNIEAVSSCSLRRIPTSEFTVSPLLTSDPGCYIATAFDWQNRKPLSVNDLEPHSYATAAYITRNVNGKEQRIVVTGDSDFLSNAQISGENTNNLTFSLAVFHNLCYGEYPIRLTYTKSTDVSFTCSKQTISGIRLSLTWILPLIFLLCGTLFLIRRKRK